MKRALAAAAILAAAGLPAAAADGKAYQVEPLKEAAPGEVAAKVRETLAAEGLRVKNPKGEPLVDVWLRKAIPTVEPKEELEVKFATVEEGTLFGVARFHKSGSDFKGNAYPAGVYTLRYGLQPKDGDHLGVSESRDFLLLSPVKVDEKLDPMPTKALVELSTKVSGIKHPSVLYLTKVAEEDARPPRVYQDDAERWVLDCEAPATGKEKAVRFGLILIGQAAE